MIGYEVIPILDEKGRHIETQFYIAQTQEKVYQDPSHTYSVLFAHQLRVVHTGQHPFRGLEKLAHKEDEQIWMEEMFEEDDNVNKEGFVAPVKKTTY